MFTGGGGGHDLGRLYNVKVLADSIEVSSTEETSTIEASVEVSSENDPVIDKLNSLENYVILIFFAIVLYFICHTIHNIFNKFRGIE